MQTDLLARKKYFTYHIGETFVLLKKIESSTLLQFWLNNVEEVKPIPKWDIVSSRGMFDKFFVDHILKNLKNGKFKIIRL